MTAPATAIEGATGSNSRRRRPRDLIRLGGLVCTVIGTLLIGVFAVGMAAGVAEQNRLNASWKALLAANPPTATTAIDPALMEPVDGIDFAIRVPKLNYYAAVREGVTQTILYSGPGHYPNTSWPGNPGTVGVAAHDVYWIQFPQLVVGDEVDLETRYGTYKYTITGTRIVNPDNTTALVPNAPGYHLTLTTCWPTWAAALATQRYIIFAKQTTPAPALE